MMKAVAKQNLFGVPSLQAAEAIDNSDKVTRATAAHYRLQTRMMELEGQFELKARELRSAFNDEMTEIFGAPEAAE
jgi:hypothetical protein